MVELIDARKRYGTVDALRGVNLSVAAGEVVAILGPNGAGKTTSISLMLGMTRPSAGRVLLLGQDPTRRQARSQAGVMLQESGVSPVLEVREVIALFRSYYPHPLPLDDAIAMAGLEEKARARVADLSGGQRQRLYYALAVCGDPPLLFLDEPTVGMDVDARRSIWRGLRDAAARGKTIILTTHHLEEADALASRVVVIDQGLVVADAPPGEIKGRFSSRRVTFTALGSVRAEDFAGMPATAVEIDGQAVRMLSPEPERLLQRIFERRLEITDLEVHGAALEDAVRRLTGAAGG